MVAILQGPFGLVTLNTPTFTIGHAPENQLVINDPSVSPYHAIIRVGMQGVSIMDAGSMNGTYVNEQRLEPNSPRFLSNNDTISMGNTRFRYEERTDSPSSPTLFADHREGNPSVPPDSQMRPSGYTAYGQQQGNPPPPFPFYTPAPSSYNSNPYDTPLAATQPVDGHTPIPPSNPQLSEGLQGQPYAPPPQQKKRNRLAILLIAAAALIVLFAVGGGLLYLAMRPQPVISVNSDYSVNMTPTGSTSTQFRVTGHSFSKNSSITFLLDGEPVPGNAVTPSDSNGQVTAMLAVTQDWAVGSHVLTAKDASGYTTKDGVKIQIVPQGQASTPGPNGAPSDDASFTINTSYRGTGSNGQITLQVTGQPDPNGGKVCGTKDDGSTLSRTGQDNGGAYTETFTTTCAGIYKGGQLSYTETIQNDVITFANGVVCTETTPFVLVRLQGTFSSATSISGSYSSDSSSPYPCKQGGTLTYSSDQGSWTGQLNQ